MKYESQDSNVISKYLDGEGHIKTVTVKYDLMKVGDDINAHISTYIYIFKNSIPRTRKTERKYGKQN